MARNTTIHFPLVVALLFVFLVLLTIAVNVYLVYFRVHGRHRHPVDKLFVNTEACKIYVSEIKVRENSTTLRIPNCGYEEILSKFDDETQVRFIPNKVAIYS
jgi:hypothetical protein